MNVLRIYVENSVIGGYFNEGFDEPTKELFELFREGVYKPVISSHVINELEEGAPEFVKAVLTTIDYEIYDVNDEILNLAKQYIFENIVTEKYFGDALHIAIATVVGVDVLVSWNFKHIVNLGKIRLFNAVNLKQGYKILEIRTPKEVLKNG